MYVAVNGEMGGGNPIILSTSLVIAVKKIVLNWYATLYIPIV